MTISSTYGFEALLRGVPVTTTGVPFYAGWGLTDDLLPRPERRKGMQPDLLSLTFTALIAYPRYYDPITNSPCSIEVALACLKDPQRRSRILAAMDRLNRLRKAF
jgi:capsular polysaccharide export protein